ncbi:hypothetical protein WN48_07866 [Eufriesea mexicana]|nr:hypothetical protein WN48_07866 [Eufriesea mexicana]
MSTDRLIQSLIRSLKELKSVGYNSPNAARKGHATAEKTLYLIFEIGLHALRFTSEDERIIGDLVADAIEPLQRNIQREQCLYRTRLNSSILKKRSALQFLVDIYGNFPSGTSTLSNEFFRVDIRESIHVLDDIIAKWHDASDSDEGQSDLEIYGLPSSHIWWDR